MISFFSHYARTWKAPRPSWEGLHKTEVPSLGLWSQPLQSMLYSLKTALTGSLDYRPTDTRLHFIQHTASSCSKSQHHPGLSISPREDTTTWRPTKPLWAYCRLTSAETHLGLERKFFGEKAQVALGGYPKHNYILISRTHGRPNGTFFCSLINLSVHKHECTAGPPLPTSPAREVPDMART